MVNPRRITYPTTPRTDLRAREVDEVAVLEGGGERLDRGLKLTELMSDLPVRPNKILQTCIVHMVILYKLGSHAV